jgi:hypothetical protein
MKYFSVLGEIECVRMFSEKIDLRSNFSCNHNCHLKEIFYKLVAHFKINLKLILNYYKPAIIIILNILFPLSELGDLIQFEVGNLP